jgi:hypothetical protein
VLTIVLPGEKQRDLGIKSIKIIFDGCSELVYGAGVKEYIYCLCSAALEIAFNVCGHNPDGQGLGYSTL